MSNILFDCPLCAASLKVDDSAAGMRVACPTCEKEIEISSGDAVISSPAQDAVPPSDRTESQDQGKSTEGKSNEDLSASDFRKVLENASAKTVKQIEEASKQTRKMIGN